MSQVETTTERIVELRKEKRFDEAERLARLAISDNQNAWQLWNQLGHVLVANQNFAEAASAFRTAAKLNPNGFWLWLSLGYAKKELNQVDDAIEVTLKATKLATKPNELGSALYNLGCYNCVAGRHDDAIQYLDRAFQEDESIRDWARDDADLDALRNNKMFLSLLKGK
jgi:Flp pilus assembly protein TadD